MPADADGPSPPPASSPGLFYTFKDNSFHFPEVVIDQLEVYEFSPDFATPANSTFSLAQSLPIAPFNYTVCGFFVSDCIPQPDTGNDVAALSEWPLHRLQYRTHALDSNIRSFIQAFGNCYQHFFQFAGLFPHRDHMRHRRFDNLAGQG